MNTQKIFDHYARKLDAMIEGNEFWTIYFQDPFSICNTKDTLYPIHCGISRGCYADEHYPYVVKWQLTGDSMECEREEEIYAHACVKGFAQYFAEPIYLGTYTKTVNTYAITAYLEMGPDDHYPTERQFAAILNMLENCGYTKEDHELRVKLWAYPHGTPVQLTGNYKNSPTWRTIHSDPDTYADVPLTEHPSVACFWFEQLGEETFKAFNAFLAENLVNDMHSGNTMLYKGNPIIIDYAGIEV